jgi:hypothetical protein
VAARFLEEQEHGSRGAPPEESLGKTGGANGMKTHNEKRRLSVSSGETARMAAPLNEKGTEEIGGGALQGELLGKPKP